MLYTFYIYIIILHFYYNILYVILYYITILDYIEYSLFYFIILYHTILYYIILYYIFIFNSVYIYIIHYILYIIYIFTYIYTSFLVVFGHIPGLTVACIIMAVASTGTTLQAEQEPIYKLHGSSTRYAQNRRGAPPSYVCWFIHPITAIAMNRSSWSSWLTNLANYGAPPTG